MSNRELYSFGRDADGKRDRRLLYLLLAVPTVLGVAHHLDHIVRGNHVGWPVTGEVTMFTYSLAIYPLIAIGLYLTVKDRVGARYWTAFFAFSTAMLAYAHVSPWAIEPPGDVIGPYSNPVVGYAAFGILLALIASTAVGTACAGYLWARGEN